MSTMEAIGGASLLFNLLLVVMQSRTQSAVADLKAHMYEKFITKDEMRLWRPD